jgi:serine protease AprX
MARKRVIAHYMHETERHAALQRIPQGEVTESYVLGDVEESDIANLRSQGLVVQILDEDPLVETPGGPAQPAPMVRRGSVAHIRATAAAAAPATVADNFYIVQMRGPLLESWKAQLAQLKVRLLEHMSGRAYTAKLVPSQVAQVGKLPFVSQVRVYKPEDTGPIALRAAASPAAGLPGGVARTMQTYDVLLHVTEDAQQVLDWLKTRTVAVAGASKKKIRIYLLQDSAMADEIAALPEVERVEEFVPPKLHNDVSRRLLGVDQENPGAGLPQTGQGQIVAVADTGLDGSHPDFQGRVVGIVARGRPGDASDPHGHGTHVAGSVLGDGSASGGLIRGVASKGKLFFQSLLDAQGGLGGLPLNLSDLFDEAYQAGARIHNNSWGSATRSMYTINSIEVDEFLAQHRDMLVVISAGNEGTAANCVHTQRGFADWLSLGSPATSKNALTVGASRSCRTAGGYSGLTYSDVWPRDFPDPPIATEKISGNADGLAGFSSRGPCDDRRIKPDVVAPGTDIASTKSSLAPLRHFWGAYPSNPAYAFMGGTSMAAPLVSGCAALVREYYAANWCPSPSAALVKATLINSTRWLAGPDATADHQAVPNYHQGFGCVYMPWAFPNPAVPGLRLEFLDTWSTPNLQFVRSGQRFRYRVDVPGGAWLRFCLAYTDLPGRALQNNLNLFIEHEPTHTKWFGNQDAPRDLKIPDPDNNIEIVRLENPAAGTYLIQISAVNLLGAPQDFALVVTGNLNSTLQPVP